MPKPSANMTLTPFTPEMEAELLERENERDAVNGNQEDALDLGQGDPEPQPEGNGDPEPEPREKPEPIQMSPQDAKRLAMADRFKRPDIEERPFDGDLTKPENLYGQVAAEQLEPDPDADEPGVPAQERQQQEQPAEKKYTIKVRGKDVHLTEAELLERASKVEAADQYLEEGRNLLEQAKQIRSGRAAADPQHPEGEERAQDDVQDRDTNQPARRPGPDLKEVVEKIQYGDPEEAAAALAEVIANTSEKAANEGHVMRMVKNDLAKSQADLKAFRAAHPELDKDPLASNLIENLVYRIYREEIVALGIDEKLIPNTPKELADWHRLYRVHGHTVSKPAEVLNKAKAEFDKWRGVSPKPANPNPAPRKEAPRVNVNVDRTERRMAIPVQPSRAVSPRRDPAPVVEQNSRKSAVQEMRRARGQPVH